MTLDDLQDLASRGGILELNIHSCEGSIYLVEALTDDGSRHLKKNAADKGPWVFRGFEAARRALFDVPLETVNLIHANVYDEMVSGGHNPGGAPAMRLTLPLRP